MIFKWSEGDNFGDVFLLKEKLGRGTYGVVGKAVRLKDGSYKKRGDRVALKIPFDQEIGEANLRKEPEIMLNFDHENIVKVYGYHTISGIFAIEMELIEGHSLAEIMDNQKSVSDYSLLNYLEWIKQIVHGLDSMGEFAHGDIKPQNILVRNDGIAKLVDFGASRRLEDAWVFTLGHGTEQYMAPEAALDNKRVSIKSDLYSIGVILYEIATGDIPFHSSFERLQGKQLTKPREINASILVIFEDLILRCLERDPDRRYADWDAFLNDLENIINAVNAQKNPKPGAPETKRYQFNPEPSSPLYYLNLAKKAVVEENYPKAIENAEAAAEASEGHPHYLRMLAAVCVRAGYLEKAKKTFNRLLDKYNSGYPAETDQLAYVIRKLAELHIQTNEYEEAVQMWRQFYDIAEDKPLAKFKLAVAYGLNGQYKKAIRLLDEVRTQRPDAVIIYSKLGWAYSLAGDYRQALSYYNQALVIDPSDLFSLYQLGKYYRIIGDRNRAMKYFGKIENYDRIGMYLNKVRELYKER